MALHHTLVYVSMCTYTSVWIALHKCMLHMCDHVHLIHHMLHTGAYIGYLLGVFVLSVARCGSLTSGCAWRRTLLRFAFRLSFRCTTYLFRDRLALLVRVEVVLLAQVSNGTGMAIFEYPR